MVKHGTAKKRRAGRTGRTKLKNGTYAKFKPPQYTSSIVKDNWDPSKSPNQNFSQMGLNGTPNASINDRGLKDTNHSEANKNGAEIEVYNVAEFTKIVDETQNATLTKSKKQKQKKLPLSLENQKYMIACMIKHGDNYTKMARDTKVNNMQHTEHVLTKMGIKFLNLTEEQRRVDVPESIQHFIDDANDDS